MNADSNRRVDGPERRPDSPVEQENPELLSLLRTSLAPGEVFLDAGANVGVFSIDLARHLGPSGQVLAFEPAPDAMQVLERRARRANVWDRIQAFQMALGSGSDLRALRADPHHPDDWTKRSLFSAGPVVQQVAVRAFDDLIRSGAVRLPKGLDSVKIDVEGAEAEVIRGMATTLEELQPRIVVVETIPDHQDRAGSSVEEITSLLDKVGYAVLPNDPRWPRFVYNTIYGRRGQAVVKP
jgi:FkbM family methyltransferase